MAGETQLSGPLQEKALRMLEDVATTLERRGVRFMLDCGTLLGVIREQRILPWDNDMDICVRAQDLKTLKKCQRDLWVKGYRARMIKSSISYGPVKQGDVRILKVRDYNGLKRGDLLLDVFIKYPDGDGNDILVLGGDVTPIVQSFEGKYFDKLTEVEFNGRMYPVPEDYEGYLSARYGDWRTPVKEWDYFTDDRSRIK